MLGGDCRLEPAGASMRQVSTPISALLGVAATLSACASEMRTIEAPDAGRAVRASVVSPITSVDTRSSSQGGDPEPVPTACGSHEGPLCLPATAFVQRLCGSPNPDVALALFAKGTPWTRGYLRRTTEA